MGYEGPYGLNARAAAEFAATWFATYVGVSVLANALLSKAKGNAMGFGWIAVGQGASAGMAISVFGWISAWQNPNILIGLWIAGGINGAGDFFALLGAQLAGSLLGGICAWLSFLPYFKNVPQVPDSDPAQDAVLLLSGNRDIIQNTILKNASYAGVKRPRIVNGMGRPVQLFHNAVNDAMYYLSGHYSPSRHGLVSSAQGRSVSLGKEGSMSSAPSDRVSLADLLDSVKASKLRRECIRRAHKHTGAIPNTSGDAGEKATAADLESAPSLDELSAAITEYEAAVVADQNTKLSVFAVRPAVFSPVFNWVNEFIATLWLVFGSLVIINNGSTFPGAYWGPAVPVILGGFVAVIIFLSILGMGGIGAVMNPARDLGPRFAHWLLPIPGKGPTEWHFAVLYVTADICGAMAGGGFYKAFIQLAITPQ